MPARVATEVSFWVAKASQRLRHLVTAREMPSGTFVRQWIRAVPSGTVFGLVRDAFVRVRDGRILSRDPWILVRDIRIRVRDRFILVRDQRILSTDPFILVRDRFILTSPDTVPTSPAFIPALPRLREVAPGRGEIKSATILPDPRLIPIGPPYAQVARTLIQT